MNLAISVKLSVEVFETRTVFGSQIVSKFLNISFFKLKSSSTASITRSYPIIELKSVDVLILERIDFLSLLVIAHLWISRSKDSSKISILFFKISSVKSIRRTSIPAEDTVWAIPLPITPAPIIATDSILLGSLAGFEIAKSSKFNFPFVIKLFKNYSKFIVIVI